MIRLSVFGTLLLALTFAGVSLHTPGSGNIGSPQAQNTLVVILCISAAVYFLAVATILRRPMGRKTLWIVLLVAAALRIPPLIAPPFLSSDVLRYVWDGRVQAAGINPYRYIPDDPALTALRDTTIYPHINRADYAPTIYPPAAQIVFAIVGQIWSSVAGIKLAMVGFEALAIICLLKLLTAAQLPAERVLIYAWNPLPVWAFAGNGHIDAAVVGFVSLALLLRVQRQDGWAGLALALATLTKFLPVVIAPALWRLGGGWRMALVALITITLLYAAYSSVGWQVLGFLRGYGTEEGLNDGSGIWLLSGIAQLCPHGLPGPAAKLYFLALALILAALGAWFAFIRRPNDPVAICAAAGVMMAVLTFGISPHYPWYFAWLAVPCVLAPNRAILWLATAPVLIYLGTYSDHYIWPTMVYAPAILLALLAVLRPSAAPTAANPTAANIEGMT
jgi:alpha-1,6-mannosyltransferase